MGAGLRPFHETTVSGIEALDGRGRDRSFVLDVAGIDEVGSLKEQQFGARLRDRQVFDASRNPQELSRAEGDFVLATVEAVLHANAARYDKKKISSASA